MFAEVDPALTRFLSLSFFRLKTEVFEVIDKASLPELPVEDTRNATSISGDGADWGAGGGQGSSRCRQGLLCRVCDICQPFLRG